jgi:aspartyl-tRNA(Asn)/glutamyl-tRNA(Gln) amidotransferase subunit C
MIASAMHQHLSVQDVDRIAALARLSLTEDERLRYSAQLERILEYVEQLSELDTVGVAATASVFSDSPGERPDDPRPSLATTDALRNAPDASADFFRVPKVIGD